MRTHLESLETWGGKTEPVPDWGLLWTNACVPLSFVVELPASVGRRLGGSDFWIWLQQWLHKMRHENITLLLSTMCKYKVNMALSTHWMSLPNSESPAMCRYKVKMAPSTHCECLYYTLDLLAPWWWIPHFQNWEKQSIFLWTASPSLLQFFTEPCRKTKTIAGSDLSRVSVNHLPWHITVL